MSYNISHAQGEILGQLRPADTVANLIYTTPELRTEITLILATLVPGAAATVDVSIWHDDSGSSTFDNDTIIWYETRTLLTQDPCCMVLFQAQHPGSGIMMKAGAQLAVGASVADDVNFTVYGITETLADRLGSVTR